MPTILEALKEALEHHQAGHLREAETLYREVLAHDPQNADALHLLGMLAYESGRHATATSYLAEAIHANPRIAPFHNNLGAVLEAQGRFTDALLCFEQALRLEPDNAKAHNNLGNALSRLGRYEEAISEYRQGLRLESGCAEAHNNLGNALRARGQFAEARACFERALELKPEYPEAYLNLANVLQDQDLLQEAEACCREALRRKPDLAEGYSNLGAILIRQNRLAEAETCCREALRRKPGLAGAQADLGAVFEARGQWEEAEACYREALQGDPNHAPAHNNLGNVLRAQGHPREALASYRRALRAQPDYAHAHWNASQVLLLLGDFEAGWREYGWRRRVRSVAPRQFSQPPWDGSPLAGRSILLHAGPGLGEAIQFVRYAPLVKERGGKVALECPPQLMRLFARAGGIDQLIPAGSPLPACDVQASLLDLPRIFGARLKTIPAQVPYLECDPGLVAEWRQKIAQAGRRSVGLVWAGNRSHSNYRNRPLTLWELAPLRRVAGVDFFSLQRGPQAEELLNPPPGLHLTELAPKATGFADAPALANLDLVITVDTAVAHLAGALARPVWTLLPFAPDWRWLLDREDSPWYPTMRLFRQPRPGDWEAVIEEVVRRLTDVFHS